MSKKQTNLATLMNSAFDETWFHVVDGKKEYFVWIADYIGGHSETMKEVLPLLHRTFGEEFSLEIRTNPENRREKVPMVRVDLDPEED